MRWLIVILLVLALGWSIYWFVAAEGTRRGFNAALDQARAQGWQVDTTGVSTRGFPNRLDTTLGDIGLTSPDGALSVRAAFVQILSLSYRPTHVIALLPEEIALTVGGQPVQITNSDLRASLSLSATPDLPLQQMRFVAEAPALTLPDGSRLSARALRAALTDADAPNYRLGFAANELALAPLPGETIELTLDAMLRLDKPLDRHVAQSPAAPVALDLTGLRLAAGDGVRADLTGQLTWASGRPQGALTLKITNWRGFLQRLEQLGLIAPEVLQGLSAQLPLIAQGADVTLPLPVRNGVVYVGALPFLWLTPQARG